jgi:hypothetical protein
MVGGVETPCHTRLPSLNYAGSNVQPSVITHSLTDPKHQNPLKAGSGELNAESADSTSMCLSRSGDSH